MKQELSSIEVRVLVQELQNAIGARVDRVYQLNDDIYLQLRQVLKGLIRIMPHFFFFTENKPEMPIKASGFCLLLRKHLEGAKITAIEQVENERIVKLTFSSSRIVFLELFGKTNLVLCDIEMNVIGELNKAGEHKTGEKYVLPEKRQNPFNMAIAEFRNLFNNETVLKILAAKLGIGKLYAEELCTRAAVDGSLSVIDGKQVLKLHEALQELVQRKIDARVVFSDDVIKDITPFPLQKYAQLKAEKFLSFNAALDFAFSKGIPEAIVQKATSGHDKQIAKIKNAIEMQKSRIIELDNAADAEQKKGEYVYEHYPEIKQLLEELISLREQGGFAAVKKHKNAKAVNEKEWVVKVEV